MGIDRVRVVPEEPTGEVVVLDVEVAVLDQAVRHHEVVRLVA
jgi:hypothetical protein